METSRLYPFPPRPGIGLEDLEFDTEQTALTGAEITQVLDFEHQLYDASLDAAAFPRAAAYKEQQEEAGTPLQSLESVWMRKVNTTKLGVSYFMTEEGRSALKNIFGQPIEAETAQEMAARLASLDIRQIESEVLDKLGADSVGYEESQLAQAFKDAGFVGANLPAPQFVKLYKNPEVLAAKAHGYQQYKAYLGQVKADLRSQALRDITPVRAAQLVLLAKYRQRINGFLANMYVVAHQLLASQRVSDGTNHDLTVTVDSLGSALPVFDTERQNNSIASFLQRIDRYRHGVSRNEKGAFTWLSEAAKALVVKTGQSSAAIADRGIYADTDPEALESTIIDGQTFRDALLAPILEKYGLLSEITEWSSERAGPADDGKWQIIVNDKFKSLAVNDKQRVVKVPNKSVTLLNAVSVGNHEIAHVLQHENKRALGDLAIMQRIGLDSPSEQTESGGMWQEKVAKQALMGVTSDSVAGTGYYKNLVIKSQGGSYGMCVQAYYEDLLVRNPTMKSDTAVAQAVNRACRVFRSGGFEFAQNTPYLTNTQPLNYLEQELIYERLADDTRRYLLIGGITIANLVELQQYGIVDMRQIRVPEQMPWQLMYPAVKAILANAS